MPYQTIEIHSQENFSARRSKPTRIVVSYDDSSTMDALDEIINDDDDIRSFLCGIGFNVHEI